MRSSAAVLLAVLAPPAFVATALRLGHDPVTARAQASLIHREDGYVGSATCKTCHPDQHASWAATFRDDDAAADGGERARGVRRS